MVSSLSSHQFQTHAPGSQHQGGVEGGGTAGSGGVWTSLLGGREA